MKKLTTTIALILMVLLSVQAACTGNFLNAQGNKLYDSNGNVVQLTGVNWFGFETQMMYPHGIYARDCRSMLQQIKDQGFNCVRIPWCNAILDPSATIKIDTYGTDPYTGVSPMNELEATKTKPIEIMDIIVEWCQENNMKVILDNHSRNPDGYMVEALWYTAEVPHAKWISDWEFMASRYKAYDAVIAMDINNEPHGAYGDGARWGTNDPANDWRLAAQECGNAILAVNPNVLILVEGTEEFEETSYWWGGNLQGVTKYPVVLSNPSKLVYSPHEYGPTVHLQDWFLDPSFPANMPAIWEDNFNYLHTNETSPLLIGEFGLRDSSGQDEVWFDTFCAFMHEKGYSWTYWCWNPNSGDTGGLLDDQWKNIVTWKMDKLRPLLAPEIPNCGGVSGNNPPTASIVPSATSGVAPLAVSFDGTGSSDPDNDPITFLWNTGETTANIAKTYTIPGSYTVSLSVNDGALTSSTSVTIVVSGSPVAVTGIALSPTVVSIEAGSTSQLVASIAPADATNKAVIWSSSAPTIASVDANGLLSALAQGNASINATTVDGNFSASCVVSVDPKTSCVFPVPQATALASLNQVFDYIHVIGNGPDLSQVTNLTINWDLQNNGLWQLSMNTNNGQPNWYIDLKSLTTHALNAASPALSISASGIVGLDGDYWVTMDGDNMVWVDKLDAFTLYFSASAIAPCGTKSAQLVASNLLESEASINMYPNPANSQVTIMGVNNVKTLYVLNVLGQVKISQPMNGSDEILINLDQLGSGIHFVRFELTNNTVLEQKLIVY